MEKILIHPVRTLKKDLLVSALYIIAFALVTFPFLVMYVKYIWEFFHDRPAPRSFWEIYQIAMGLLLPLVIVTLWILEIVEYAHLKWYPYFFSPDKHFFLKVKSVSFEEIRRHLESQTWKLLKQSSTSISFKFKGSGGGYHDRDWLVAQRNFTWRSTDVEIRRFDINDGVLIYICFRQTGIGRRGGGQTSRKTLGARTSLVDELFPDAEFCNQKWQRIDRQWNIINANSLQGAPIVEFAKPKKIMGWNVD
jgi:hypothetical protein